MKQSIKWIATALATAASVGVGLAVLAGGVKTPGVPVAATGASDAPPAQADAPAEPGKAGEPGTNSPKAGRPATESGSGAGHPEDPDDALETAGNGVLHWPGGLGGTEPTPKPPQQFDLSGLPQQHKAGKDAAVNTGYTTGLKGCQLECIKKATGQATGDSATFVVETHVPTKMWVIITGEAPEYSGDTPKTHWTTTVNGLDPGTKYDVTIAAEDTDGHTRTIFGNFTTQTRMTTLTFDKIHVIGDADKGANRGEISFYFEVDGARFGKRDSQKIASGTTVHLREGRGKPAAYIADAPDKLHLRIAGLEDDTKVFGCSPNPLHPTPADTDKGEGGPCWDAAAAKTGIDLTPGKTRGAFTDTLLVATTEHKLKFAVTVQVKVWYE